MTKFKKTGLALYLLVFLIYAISPIIASVPEGFDRRQYAAAGDLPSARLLLVELLADEAGGKGAALSSSAADEADILLKKKRTLLSSKVLLDIVLTDSLVHDRQTENYHVRFTDSTKPAYYSSLYYFVSGISPPALS